MVAMSLVITCEPHRSSQTVTRTGDRHNLHRNSEWNPSDCILAQFQQCAYDSLPSIRRIPQIDQRKRQLERRSIVRRPQNSHDRGSVTVRPSLDLASLRTGTTRVPEDVGQTVSRGMHWQAVETSTIDNVLLTAYAVSEHSTGKKPGDPGFGITFSGHKAKVNWTVAVDPHVIPIGTLLYIEGVGLRMAEDTGGAVKGKHVDVLLKSDADALQFGVRRHVRVYVLKPNTGSHKAQNIPSAPLQAKTLPSAPWQLQTLTWKAANKMI